MVYEIKKLDTAEPNYKEYLAKFNDSINVYIKYYNLSIDTDYLDNITSNDKGDLDVNKDVPSSSTNNDTIGNNSSSKNSYGEQEQTDQQPTTCASGDGGLTKTDLSKTDNTAVSIPNNKSLNKPFAEDLTSSSRNSPEEHPTTRRTTGQIIGRRVLIGLGLLVGAAVIGIVSMLIPGLAPLLIGVAVLAAKTLGIAGLTATAPAAAYIAGGIVTAILAVLIVVGSVVGARRAIKKNNAITLKQINNDNDLCNSIKSEKNMQSMNKNSHGLMKQNLGTTDSHKNNDSSPRIEINENKNNQVGENTTGNNNHSSTINHNK